ncbi:MAG: hypothetical protein H7321_04540 [Bacteroidia bacterium]|nr:hypothetical protein [Bacteroidia bacterium]
MLKLTKEQIAEISDFLGSGMTCYIHKETLKMTFIHEDMVDDDSEEENENIEENPDDYYTIEAMDSRDSFRIMEDFTEEIQDTILKNKLIAALNMSHPFRHFKDIIETTNHREEWFKFSEQRNIEHVEAEIEGINISEED